MEIAIRITEKLDTQIERDIMFHKLTEQTAFLSELAFSNKKELPIEIRRHNRLNFFEFKLFTIAFFINFIRKEDSIKAKEFLFTCINQFVQEINSLEIDAVEGFLYMPGNFNRGKEYINEKLLYYMKDLESFIQDDDFFPKFSYLCLVENPLQNNDALFFDLVNSVQIIQPFLDNYSLLNWFFELMATDYTKFKLAKSNYIKTL
jgi:hypothetical protein